MIVIAGIALVLVVLIIAGGSMSGAFDNSSSTNLGATPSGSLTSALANAIAKAEGFFLSGSLPNRANNPGDLEIGNQGNGLDSGKTVFATADDGWNALYNQIDLMLTRQSSIYDPSMTISQVAQLYTGGDNADAWASNVASQLGVTPDTTLADLQSQYGGA